MQRLLIVGGAGYVGGWLTDAALADGHDVRVYDSLVYEDRFLKDVAFVAGDVLDHERLARELAWADCVVWLAAVVGDAACEVDTALTRRVNLDSVGWFAEHYDGRIVYPSTCSVYGAQVGELDEDAPTAPLSLYAETKLEAERVLLGRRPEALVARLGTLAGVGDAHSRVRFDLVVNLLVAHARTTRRLRVNGGHQYRPLLHVRDVATAVLPHVATAVGGAFNLGTENVTIGALAGRIADRLGGVEIESQDAPLRDTRSYRVSFARAREVLGFRPAHTIDQAIDEVARLLDEGRVKDPTLAQFSNLEVLRSSLLVAPDGLDAAA